MYLLKTFLGFAALILTVIVVNCLPVHADGLILASTVAGVFTETTLRSLRVKADALMMDERIKQQFIPKIEIINAIRSLQTASITPKLTMIKEPDGRVKKYDVEILWDNACEITAEDNVECTTSCTELSTNTQLYSLDWTKQASFCVDEFNYLDNEFDASSAAAKGFLKADKELVEAYARYCTTVIEANKGVNAMGTGSKGVVSGADTYVLPAYWDAKLVAYFVRVAQLNRFSNFALISGSNLFEEYFVIQKMIADANGKGNAALLNTLNIYFDLFNIDSVNTPDLVTYLVNQGALAMATRAFNPVAPEKTHTFTRYQMASRFVPEFNYDVFYETECSHDLVKHKFRVKLQADLFANPVGCDANNTGILTMICGEP